MENIMPAYHTPVLLEESMEALQVKPNGTYVDATMGGAGHTRRILEMLGPEGKLIAFDKDEDAVKNAPCDDRLTVVRNNFRFMENFLEYWNIKADGILADLGVSSHQFDTADRGFSFRFDAELDMRMNRLGGKTARDILNSYGYDELKAILENYGEVEKSGKIADMICKYREKQPINTTDDLRDAILKALPANAEHKFLAKIYQALRIEVNGEIAALEDFMRASAKCLKKGGRLVVITYHSIEDRIVKNFIKAGNADGQLDKDIFGRSDHDLKAVNKKPILPSEDEIRANTRSRSAKLRTAEKI